MLPRRLRGEPLKPFVYRDFGSLISLGDFSTVGSLMDTITRRSMMIEGWFAMLMYRALYKMHEFALHGFTKVTLDTLARILTRRTEPHVKLTHSLPEGEGGAISSGRGGGARTFTA